MSITAIEHRQSVRDLSVSCIWTMWIGCSCEMTCQLELMSVHTLKEPTNTSENTADTEDDYLKDRGLQARHKSKLTMVAENFPGDRTQTTQLQDASYMEKREMTQLRTPDHVPMRVEPHRPKQNPQPETDVVPARKRWNRTTQNPRYTIYQEKEQNPMSTAQHATKEKDKFQGKTHTYIYTSARLFSHAVCVVNFLIMVSCFRDSSAKDHTVNSNILCVPVPKLSQHELLDSDVCDKSPPHCCKYGTPQTPTPGTVRTKHSRTFNIVGSWTASSRSSATRVCMHDCCCHSFRLCDLGQDFSTSQKV